MDLIQFEDGTKVSNAKVTINGVDYPVTPARYTGNTPLSAYILNLMQNNIAKVVVPTGGTTGQVLVKKSDNDNDVEWQTGGSGGASGDTLPIGAIIPYTSDTIPTNWLLCDGSAISRTEYSDLFNVIGTTYGQGDGLTTFNLPNIVQPYITQNYIIKAFQSSGVVANVAQTDTDSDTDVYGCNYINEHLVGTILYNDTTGSRGDITLSDNASNYKYIEVFGFADTDKYTSVKIYNPNGKKFVARINYTSGNLLVDLLSTFTINGTTISPILNNCGYSTISTTAVANFSNDNTNYFNITRVVGYK